MKKTYEEFKWVYEQGRKVIDSGCVECKVMHREEKIPQIYFKPSSFKSENSIQQSKKT